MCIHTLYAYVCMRVLSVCAWMCLCWYVCMYARIYIYIYIYICTCSLCIVLHTQHDSSKIIILWYNNYIYVCIHIYKHHTMTCMYTHAKYMHAQACTYAYQHACKYAAFTNKCIMRLRIVWTCAYVCMRQCAYTTKPRDYTDSPISLFARTALSCSNHTHF
jgi:hypothetical protein